jgi:hypothetical protein
MLSITTIFLAILLLPFRNVVLAEEEECPTCCFAQNPEQDVLTTGSWWTNYDRVQPNRHYWFRARKPFEPIVGSDEGTIVAGVLYTHTKETLKMSVLFPPLHPVESRKVTVYLIGSTSAQYWVQHCDIREETWHCLVRFDSIPHTEEYTYEVQYAVDPTGKNTTFYSYGGNVPMQKDFPRIAATSCYGPDRTYKKGGFRAALRKQEPDILLLQGDQTYFHSDVSCQCLLSFLKNGSTVHLVNVVESYHCVCHIFFSLWHFKNKSYCTGLLKRSTQSVTSPVTFQLLFRWTIM